MEPTEVERLKREWTGRRVAVASEAPRLRRFRTILGTVVTLNMNGRALVRFDGPVDIGWYDVALADLNPVAAPPPPEERLPPPPGEPPVTSATQPKPKSASGPTAEKQSPPAAPLSILEIARRQGAAKRSEASE